MGPRNNARITDPLWPLAPAEGDLLALIRHEGTDFTVTVNRSKHHWSVSTEVRDAAGSGNATGRGTTFAEAWRRQQCLRWLRSPEIPAR
jgi:hypothetical protein